MRAAKGAGIAHYYRLTALVLQAYESLYGEGLLSSNRRKFEWIQPASSWTGGGLKMQTSGCLQSARSPCKVVVNRTEFLAR
jgi:hypothetical protein